MSQVSYSQSENAVDRLAGAIRSDISEGVYPPLTALPTYRVLRDRYSVSQNTVQQALAQLIGDGLVYRPQGRRGSAMVRGGVAAAGVDEALRCITIVGWWDADTSKRIFAAHEDLAGYSAGMEHTPAKLRFVNFPAEGDVQALNGLLSPLFPPDEQAMILTFPEKRVMARLEETGATYLVKYHCDYRLDGLPPHHRIFTNERKAGFDVGAHLVTMGHRRLGYVGPIPKEFPRCDACNGFTAAALNAGLRVRDEDMLGMLVNDSHAAYPAIKSLLERTDRPGALFCRTDGIAKGALMAAAALNLNVPDDISVVGYNNEPWTIECLPPLTTVATPRRRGAEEAIHRLFAIKRGEVDGRLNEVLECKLVKRASVRALAGGAA